MKQLKVPLLSFIVLCGLFVAAEFWRAGQVSLNADDAWIHAQFARNLAAGFGFSYNLGEPVPGFTSAIWVVLVALAFKLTGQFVIPMKMMGVLAGLGCVVVAKKLAEDLKSEDAGINAAFAVALSPLLATASLSGMETSLWTLLVLLGFWFHVRFFDKPSWSWAVEGFIWGLASLARPEALAFFGLTAFHKLFRHRFSSLLWLILMFVIVAVVVSPWVIFNFQHTGTPFPATYLAKAVPSRRHALTVTMLIGVFSLLLWLTINPTILASIYFAVRRVLSQRLWFEMTLLAIPFAFILFRLAIHRMPPVQPYFTRYYLPALLLLSLFGMVWGMQKFHKQGRWLIIVGALLGCLWVADIHGWMVQNTTTMQVNIGKWLAKNTPKDALIATNDVGAIAFFSQRRIIDMHGLVMPEIIPFAWGRMGTGIWGTDEEGVWQFLRKRKPDYLVIFPEWYPMLSKRPELKPLYRIKLAHNVICGSDEMVVYRINWSERNEESR
ncbi:MAG: glycosyltransferase family 39 protein [Armatimonadetes bacterium]|nr:glycosyltransferase family 39 protein [Armatimonadota bacterium]